MKQVYTLKKGHHDQHFFTLLHHNRSKHKTC